MLLHALHAAARTHRLERNADISAVRHQHVQHVPEGSCIIHQHQHLNRQLATSSHDRLTRRHLQSRAVPTRCMHAAGERLHRARPAHRHAASRMHAFLAGFSAHATRLEDGVARLHKQLHARLNRTGVADAQLPRVLLQHLHLAKVDRRGRRPLGCRRCTCGPAAPGLACARAPARCLAAGADGAGCMTDAAGLCQQVAAGLLRLLWRSPWLLACCCCWLRRVASCAAAHAAAHAAACRQQRVRVMRPHRHCCKLQAGANGLGVCHHLQRLAPAARHAHVHRQLQPAQALRLQAEADAAAALGRDGGC